MKENFWDNIWRLWPLILIAFGFDGLFRRYEIAGPVVMFGLGSIFLLNNLGILSWGAWDVLWRLWPVILVAVGIEILIGRRSVWVSLLSVTLIIATLGGVVWLVGDTYLDIGVVSEENSVNQALNDIADARISIIPAVGQLKVGKSWDSTILVGGSYEAEQQGSVSVNYFIEGVTGVFDMRTHPVVTLPGDNGWVWDLVLSGQIPLDLSLSMAIGQMEADLSGLVLNNLQVKQAVGEIDISLSPAINYDSSLSQAVGKIRIGVPESVGTQIEVNRAISSLSIPTDFEHQGDYYYSPNYENATTQISLEISQAIGSIEVYQEP